MKVFISHSTADRELASQLSERLAQKGVPVSTHAEVVAGGDRWTERISEALHQADAIVLVVSSGQQADPTERQEWSKVLQEVFDQPSKKLVPILFGAAEPPSFVRNLSALRIQPGDDLETTANRLLERLQQDQGAEQQLVRTSAEDRDRWRKRVDELVLSTNTLRSGQE